MKNEKLSQEELVLVENFRKQKEMAESAAKTAAVAMSEKKEAERLRAEKSARLEVEFKIARKKAHSEILERLDNAQREIKEAVNISEKYGIPFCSDVEGMPCGRNYVPASFDKKWDCLDEQLLEDLDIYDTTAGWEYWRTSGLSC